MGAPVFREKRGRALLMVTIFAYDFCSHVIVVHSAKDIKVTEEESYHSNESKGKLGLKKENTSCKFLGLLLSHAC